MLLSKQHCYINQMVEHICTYLAGINTLSNNVKVFPDDVVAPTLIRRTLLLCSIWYVL